MKGFSKFQAGLTAALLMASASLAAADTADALAGRWDATITVKGSVIPFRLDISGSGPSLKGTFYNGDDPETTTSASFDNGTVVLDMEHYLTKVTARQKGSQLDGTVEMRGAEGGGYAFHAKRHVNQTVSTKDVPSLDGNWEIPHEKPTPKGEKAWRFIVRQNGAEISAAILRVDGDTGALTGTWKNGKAVLSHFDGSRPGLMEISLNPDGTLNIVETASNRAGKMIAWRAQVARAKGLPEPENYLTHTTVRDANEPFTFRFPDVNGNVLSSDDPKFKGKVVLAIVTGTWCPNCHDEAQYLVPLYKKYRDQGLEIVALDFEEPEQQDQLSRAKAFIKQYGVEYTYLIAGAPVEMWEKVPQAVNLNTWPATLFVGRDGLVKAIHSGFAAPASGEFNLELKHEFTSIIEKLLAENAGGVTSTASSAKPALE